METWILGTPRIHHCEPSWRWQPKPLSDFDFWLVLSGAGQLTLAGASRDLQAGSWFLLQPGDQPAGSHDAEHPLSVFACHFHRSSPGRLTEAVISGLISTPLHQEAAAAARACTEGPTGRLLAAAILRHMILQALHETLQDPSPSRTRLGRLAMEVRSAPGRAWTIPDMARHCGLSVPHFNRLWLATFGVSPGRYLIEHRIRRATQLLRESDLPIQQVAESLGYNDVYFFHRQFRRFAGITPRSARLGDPSLLDDLREKL
jgi:AraC family transcriptional regulator of arabinose operon